MVPDPDSVRRRTSALWPSPPVRLTWVVVSSLKGWVLPARPILRVPWARSSLPPTGGMATRSVPGGAAVDGGAAVVAVVAGPAVAGTGGAVVAAVAAGPGFPAPAAGRVAGGAPPAAVAPATPPGPVAAPG